MCFSSFKWVCCCAVVRVDGRHSCIGCNLGSIAGQEAHVHAVNSLPKINAKLGALYAEIPLTGRSSHQQLPLSGLLNCITQIISSISKTRLSFFLWFLRNLTNYNGVVNTCISCFYSSRVCSVSIVIILPTVRPMNLCSVSGTGNRLLSFHQRPQIIRFPPNFLLIRYREPFLLTN